MERTIKKDKVSQTFDLEELLGYSPSTEQKELFYKLAVDKMVERTVSGSDVNGSKFPSYNKDYAAEKGVSVGSVDLVLTGDMLDSFSDNYAGDMVTISVNSSNAGKAHGNITGSYGKPSGVKSKARDFFGFKNKSDVSDIVSQVNALRESDVEFSNGLTDLAELRALVNQIRLEISE